MESLNGYSLTIIGGRIQPQGLVSMEHLQNYKIKLVNHHSERCQATLKIDGHHIGNFIINPYDTIIIEGPVHSPKKFKFVLTDTVESHIGGIESGNYFNGLVEASFIPEIPLYFNQVKQVKYDSDLMTNCSSSSSPSPSRYQEGGTVLGGRSDQQFTTVSPIMLDYSRETNLSVRLVGMNPISHIEPLNPIRLISPIYSKYQEWYPKPSHPEWYPKPPQPEWYPKPPQPEWYPKPPQPEWYPTPKRIPPPPPVGKKPDPWFKNSFYNNN